MAYCSYVDFLDTDVSHHRNTHKLRLLRFRATKVYTRPLVIELSSLRTTRNFIYRGVSANGSVRGIRTHKITGLSRAPIPIRLGRHNGEDRGI